ncbi:MAG: hypothetical protein KatS3mg111_3740 [Pirellulaceae bacterium]|nr:MAG: hypothetical protein KatS3mg111_3740 [Pirellulaceae bacterium]
MSGWSLCRIPVQGVLLACLFSIVGVAQPPGRRPVRTVVSPEVESGKVTFRLFAPSADDVQVSSSDLGATGFQGTAMTRGEDGMWELELQVPPGYYRYNFMVDGVVVVDPANQTTSESNSRLWSLLEVPGEQWMDRQQVPQGAIAEVTYWSNVLGRFRRMHVYTPPGYEAGTERYPVLFLLHGATDSDDSWSTVGRAGVILDNLIAAGKAEAMIVVMPNGHTGPFRFGQGGGEMFGKFEQEFVEDILPAVDQRYRVHTDRSHRALAGLSMGGAHTLFIGLANPEQFGYLSVFSSGLFGLRSGEEMNEPARSFLELNKEKLDDEKMRAGLKHFSFVIGKDDFLLDTAKATVEMLRSRGFEVEYTETSGGHTWDNWRRYLYDLLPKLFQD